MAGHFISELERARKHAAKPRPSMARRLGALVATVAALIGWAEFGPKGPSTPVPQEAVVIAPAVQPDAQQAAPLPIPAAPPTRRAARRERPSVPLNGAGEGAGEDGLYVLSAAELADISQAGARNEHTSATLIVAEATPQPAGEVAPTVAPLGEAATTRPAEAETGAHDGQDQGRQSRRRIRRR